MRVLVTGAAGFIGFHACQALLQQGYEVMGIDNLNAYYAVTLKQARLDQLKANPSFTFRRLDLVDVAGLKEVFANFAPDRVLHLAAQAGVRHSLIEPGTYVQSNLVGFANVLEACRLHKTKHFVYASSSSVYGDSTVLPLSLTEPCDRPLNLYAATKKSNELMAHSYAHLFGLPCTGLRFFTVYGPWGRPDMACYRFIEAILQGTPVEVYNHGNCYRDFTYIDDIIDGVLGALHRPPGPNAQGVPYALYNLGSHRPILLTDFLETLESLVGQPAIKVLLPMQPGDMTRTFADIGDAQRDLGFEPRVSLEEGLTRLVEWYFDYHRVDRPLARSSA